MVDDTIKTLLASGATPREIARAVERVSRQVRIEAYKTTAQSTIRASVKDWDQLYTFLFETSVDWAETLPLLADELAKVIVAQDSDKLVLLLALYAKYGLDSSRRLIK